MLDPAELKKYFYFSQMGLGALIIVGLFFVRRSKDSGSFFRVREADKHKQQSAHSKMPIRKEDGPNFKGLPHQVLGVGPDASEEEIMEAYKDLMKLYHPDRVAAQGSARWHEAQVKAKLINIAKDQMLKNKPSRSGR